MLATRSLSNPSVGLSAPVGATDSQVDSVFLFCFFFSWGRIYFFSVNNKNHTLAVKYMCTVYYCKRSHFLCRGADWKHTQPVISVLHLSAICWLQSVSHTGTQHPRLSSTLLFNPFSVDIHCKYLYAVQIFSTPADTKPFQHQVLISTSILVVGASL